MFAKNLGLYVDYENLRQTLIRGFGQHPDPTHIGSVIRKAAQEEGKLVVQNVYGDWKLLHTSPDGTRRIEAKPALSKAGLNPVDVPVKGSGADMKDRTDIWLAIDVAFDVFTVRGLKKVMIASSDGDYCPLVRKIQSQNKDVVVCGFSTAMGPELQNIANKTIFLDQLLGITPVDNEAELIYNWNEFIEALAKAESLRWSFVGLKRFRDSWLNPNMGVSNPSQKHDMINYAIREQIVLKHMVAQPGFDHDTTAIKLNRQHPLVKEFFDR
jgi:NYN domain